MCGNAGPPSPTGLFSVVMRLSRPFLRSDYRDYGQGSSRTYSAIQNYPVCIVSWCLMPVYAAHRFSPLVALGMAILREGVRLKRANTYVLFLGVICPQKVEVASSG